MRLLQALCCLREGEQISTAVQQQCSSEKLWASVLKAKDSFLWLSEPLESATQRELDLLGRFVTGILKAPAQLAMCGEGGIFVFRILIQLAIHQSCPSRRLAEQVLKEYVASMAVESSERLLAALEFVAKRSIWPGGNEAAQGEEVTAPTATTVATRAPRLARIAVVALARSFCVTELLPRALLICHHPNLMANRHAPWFHLCTSWEMQTSVAALLRVETEAICVHLAGEKGAMSMSATVRAAALAALETFIRSVGSASLPKVLPQTIDHVRSLGHTLQMASVAEIRILRTPDGRLSSDPVPATETDGESGASANDWEKEVRAKLSKKESSSIVSKATKGGAKSSTSKQEALREKQLAEEKTVRDRLRAHSVELKCQAELLHTILVASTPDATTPYVSQALESIMPLPMLRIFTVDNAMPSWIEALFLAVVGCGSAPLRTHLHPFTTP